MAPSLKLEPAQQAKFAASVRKDRKKAKMTLVEFANKVGVSFQQISRIEKGVNLPSLPLFVEICHQLGYKQLPLIGKITR